jgi:hypothetical protein
MSMRVVTAYIASTTYIDLHYSIYCISTAQVRAVII